jgi:2-(1,2-epoxy-1,2-dihydrophenyl)acetyl-CoA isomerase
MLTAREALAIGLVTRVVADDQVEAAGAELARSLATSATVALGHMKHSLDLAETAPLGDCLDGEAWRQTVCMTTADHKEAAAAFVEKRAPKFTGK